jgi:hypothetical protein
MWAVGARGGVAREQTPFPKWLRVCFFAALALLFILVSPATPAQGQADQGWSFENDAFADLWFHGLAVLGFHGFGPMPLYDPAYTLTSRAERHEAGLEPTPLEERRAEFLALFQRDEAFEVLHFVPLYFGGASVDASLRALSDVASATEGVPTFSEETRLGGSVVASVLSHPAQRRTLATFLEALSAEWRDVVAPRRERTADARRALVRRLGIRWTSDWAVPLADFLAAEGFDRGSAVAVEALGSEGRFLENHPSRQGHPFVAVGLVQGDTGLDAALSSLVREMCYPAVRRAFGPFEGRFEDRVDASRASDLAATRCGELLLEEHAPDKVAVYRARFGLPREGSGAGFLSTSGNLTGVPAWEGQLEAALLRELNLDPDEVRAAARPVGRN